MRVGIDESGQNHASADIQLSRRSRFGQCLNVRSRSDCRDAPIPNQNRAITDQAKIRESRAAARTASAQSQQLRSTSDEKGIAQGARIMPKPAGEVR